MMHHILLIILTCHFQLLLCHNERSMLEISVKWFGWGEGPCDLSFNGMMKLQEKIQYVSTEDFRYCFRVYNDL